MTKVKKKIIKKSKKVENTVKYFQGCLKCTQTCKQFDFATVLRCPNYTKK